MNIFFLQHLCFGYPFFLSLSDGVVVLDLVNFRPSVSQMVRFFVYPVMPPKFVLVSEDTAAWGARARPHPAKLRRTRTPSTEASGGVVGEV